MTDATSLVSTLATGRQPIELEADILDLVEPPAAAHYDRMGWLYDACCGTTLYNRAVWGTTPMRSRAFAERVFASRAHGPHVELGCGSLLFTSALYDDDRGRSCILVDQSLSMLRMARRRLRKRLGRVPSYVALVRADARSLPLAPGFASTVLSMHVLHVIADRTAFLRTLIALATPRESAIGFSSLVTTGGFRDRFLTALHRAGELSEPLSSDAFDRLAHAELPLPPTIECAGNMRFVGMQLPSDQR
jgi:SAM-dependent methyltransferase